MTSFLSCVIPRLSCGIREFQMYTKRGKMVNVRDTIQNINPRNTNKKEVFLRSFDLDGEGDDHSIQAACDVFWITSLRAFDYEPPYKVDELFQSPDAIMQAVNNGSPNFIYTTRPKDSSIIPPKI